MKKYLGIIALTVFSLAFASLLNTPDFILNQDNQLGGNPAAKAYNNREQVVGGLTVLNSLAQSDSLLNTTTGYKGTDSATNPNLASDIYLQYVAKTTKCWYDLTYSKDTTFYASRTLKPDPTAPGKREVSMYDVSQKAGASISTEISKGMFLGANLSLIKNISKTIRVSSSDLGGAAASYDYGDETAYLPYLTLGGIYDVNINNKITLAYTKKPNTKTERIGRAWDDEVTNYNKWEAQQDVLSIGYIQQTTAKLETYVGMDMNANKNYTYTRYDAGANTKEIEYDKTLIGYNTYKYGVDYKLANDLTVQGVYSIANNIGRYTTDSAFYRAGINTTGLDLSIVKELKDQVISGGINTVKSVELNEDNKQQDAITETTVYGNYAYLL